MLTLVTCISATRFVEHAVTSKELMKCALILTNTLWPNALHGITSFQARCNCSLRLLNGKSLHSALPLMKPGQVSCLEGEHSGRRVYKVKASHGPDVYTVLPWHYCTCAAFGNHIRKGDGQPV